MGNKAAMMLQMQTIEDKEKKLKKLQKALDTATKTLESKDNDYTALEAVIA